jgi:hypothetical protein
VAEAREEERPQTLNKTKGHTELDKVSTDDSRLQAEVQALLTPLTPALDSCYQKALLGQPDLGGKVVLLRQIILCVILSDHRERRISAER